MTTRLLVVLFIIGAALLAGCNATGQGVETAPLPTSTVADQRASAAAVQLLAATEMSATAEATLSVEAYPPPESPPIQATLSPTVAEAPPPTETPFSYPVYTPLPTGTAAPTSIPASTITSTPFPAQPVAEEHLPALTHDLLFLQEGTLMRWNHRTNNIEALAGMAIASRRMPLARPLAGPGAPPGWINAFTVSPDGRWVMFAWSAGMPLRQIVRLDLETLRAQVLVEGAVSAAALSADGRWILYDIEPGQREVEAGRYLHSAEGSEGSHTVVPCATNLEAELAVCQDEEGQWLVEAGQRTRLLFLESSRNFNADQSETLPAAISLAHDWSPSGRYRLFWMPGATEGVSKGVMDMVTGWQAEIPNSFHYVGAAPQLRWISGDRLLMTDLRQVLIWHIGGESEPGLVQEVLYTLDDVPTSGSITAAPANLPDGRIAFAVTGRPLYPSESDEPAPLSGLFIVDAPGTALQVNTLPLGETEVWWAPDGSGAVIRSYDASEEIVIPKVLYVPADGSLPHDLSGLIPAGAGSFAWVPNP